ncbi:MAG TPA: SagB/ThcOx family dehydrogenase [Gemmatimonadales bacterium]|nr:SagB/ThcOx family dehydrogenase [Gemmatimonadales bacterium]
MVLLLIGLIGALRQGEPPRQAEAARQIVTLPPPRERGPLSLEEALRSRRSVRRFAGGPLSLVEVSQLLWAAQGTTSAAGGRTAPSAGALYPLELYVVVGDVTALPRGIYRYRPRRHDLVRVDSGEDRRSALATAALGQRWISSGAVVFVIAAEYERTTAKYGERGERYVHMEVGHVAQNVYLQAAALRVATVFVGAFRDSAVARVLELPATVRPLGLMPLGRMP